MPNDLLEAHPTRRDSSIDWLLTIPSHWGVLPARRLFAQVREDAWESDEQLAATQKYGVIPQRLFMESEGQKVVLALTGTENFKHVRKDDFVISLRSFQGGIERCLYEGCVSPAYTVLRSTRPFDARFWAYLMKSAPFVAALQSVTDGIREGKTIRYDQFSTIGLPVVPKPDQGLIADFLDRETAKIDELIAKQERLIGLLNEKRQAVISHAVTKGLDPTAPMKESNVEFLGDVPHHWQVKPLMRLTPDTRQIMYGIVLPGPHVDEGVPIVKGGDVAPGRLTLSLLNRTTFEIEAGYARSRLEGGDIVYAIRGSIGAAEIVPEEISGANLTQDAARVAPKCGVNNRWLLYALRSSGVFRQLDQTASGATIRGINIFNLKRAKIPVPPPNEQQEIASFLESELEKMDRLVSRAVRSIELMREHRSALISAAVTGKIDVREMVA